MMSNLLLLQMSKMRSRAQCQRSPNAPLSDDSSYRHLQRSGPFLPLTIFYVG